METISFVRYILAALVLGAIIGAERQRRQRLAGMRTNALVALGSAMFVSISLMLSPDTSPTRIAAQVVSGIGFLGAGLIVREGFNVQGLNTAATLWCSGAVGTLCGVGFITEASIGTAAVLLTHILLRPLGQILDKQRRTIIAKEEKAGEALYQILVVCRNKDEQRLRSLLLHTVIQKGLSLRALVSEDVSNDKLEIQAEIWVEQRDDRKLEEIVGTLSLEPSISAISWKVISDVS
ncbi:MAG: MgtC/SapB family protein [Pyrinomonadaceae bacterium]|nr:MgtC/SapB family protein [Pyrinomonadaceae bacterium]